MKDTLIFQDDKAIIVLAKKCISAFLNELRTHYESRYPMKHTSPQMKKRFVKYFYTSQKLASVIGFKIDEEFYTQNEQKLVMILFPRTREKEGLKIKGPWDRDFAENIRIFHGAKPTIKAIVSVMQEKAFQTIWNHLYCQSLRYTNLRKYLEALALIYKLNEDDQVDWTGFEKDTEEE